MITEHMTVKPSTSTYTAALFINIQTLYTIYCFLFKITKPFFDSFISGFSGSGGVYKNIKARYLRKRPGSTFRLYEDARDIAHSGAKKIRPLSVIIDPPSGLNDNNSGRYAVCVVYFSFLSTTNLSLRLAISQAV